MNSFKLKHIFKNYLEGRSPAKDEKIVDDWYRKNDDKTPVFLTEEKEHELKELIWKQIEPALRPESALVPQMTYQQDYTWMKIAASLLLVIAAGILWSKRGQPLHQPAIAFTNISTAAGERKVVSLSDGSLLTLNSGSLIRIATDFSTRRNVQILDGEVYFEVKHDLKRPFIIRSGPVTTQVLGTSFNVQAYKELNKISVGVTSGKVGVMIPDQPAAMLGKGRQLIYSKDKKRILLVKVDPHLLDWQKGTLILNDASFEEMTVLIRKNFNIKVATTNQHVIRQHFTATLNTAMTATQALEVIVAIHKRNIKKRRDTIEIY